MCKKEINGIIASGIVLLFLATPLGGMAESISSPVTTFSDGSTARTISFGPGGGWNNTTSITLPRGVNVTGANLTVSPGSGLETGHFFANASAIAASASSLNLSLRDNSITLSDDEGLWGQDVASGFAGTVLTDLEIKNDGLELAADNETWTQKASGATPRFKHSAVWDTQNNQMLVFGGTSTNTSHKNDLWAYSPSTNTWTQKASGATPRFEHSAVWDTQNNQMLVFGGYGGNGTGNSTLNDLWAYNPITGSWTQKASGATPRITPSAVWDSQNNQMLVFGGITDGSTILNDLWAYSPSNDTWAQKASGATQRDAHTAVWDSQDNQMLVFGGYGGNGTSIFFLNDLWAYNPSDNSWTQKASGATQRCGHSAVWDTLSNQMFVFGGNICSSDLNDTWAYSPPNNTWTQRANGATARNVHTAVWDSDNNQMLIFGGWNNYSVSYFDVWAYSLRFVFSGSLLSPVIQQPLASYGSVHVNITLPASTSYSIDILNSFTNVTLQSGLHNGDSVTVRPSEHPAIRLKLTMCTSDNRTTPVLGGWGLGTRIVEDFRQPAPGQNAVNVAINDGLRLGKDWGWTQKANGAAPRMAHTAVVDGKSNQMLVFGGSIGPTDDLWTYNISNNSWTQKASGATPRGDHTAVWDSQNNQMLIFGGWDGSCLNDLWAYRPSNDTWVQKASGATPRIYHSAVWDSQDNQMLVFGGYNYSSHSWSNDLWAYSPFNDTWTQKASGATSRFHHTAVWDNQNNQMLVFGGFGWNGTGNSTLKDLWAYSLSTNTWAQKASGATQRDAHTAVWDNQNNQMLVFGGYVDTGTPSFVNDLWAYYASNDTWTQKASGATPRNEHTAVWDSQNNQMLVYGGWTDPDTFNDTWAFGTHYFFNGSLTSPVCALPAITVSFRPITYTATTPPGTSITINLRSSFDNVSWSPWEQVTNGSSPNATHLTRYLQWRANLSTTDDAVTPVLYSISIGYTLFNSTGALTSGLIHVSAKLVKVTPHLNAMLNGGTIVILLSADGGAHWQNATDGVTLTFQYSGKSLMYRLEFNAAPDGTSPTLLDLSMDYWYVSFPTGIVLNVGNFTHPLGNLTGNITVDIASDLNGIITNIGQGPDNITVIISLFSASGGVLNLTDLDIAFVPNHLPVISSPQPSDGATVNNTDVALNWTVSDQDNDTLLFEVSLNGTVVASNLTTPGFVLQNLSRNTTYSWSVRAFDGKEWVESPQWHFNVYPKQIINHPPIIASPQPSDGATVNGTDVALNWIAWDPDNDALLFEVSLNGTVVAANLTAPIFLLHNLAWNTTYSWNLRAFDGKAWSTGPDWRFITPPDRPPVFVTTSLPDATVGKTYKFRLCAIDIDGDHLTFKLMQGPAGLTVDANGTLCWTPESDGTYQVSVQVSDGNLNATKTFTIHVNPGITTGTSAFLSLAWGVLATLLILLVLGAVVLIQRKKISGRNARATKCTKLQSTQIKTKKPRRP